MPDDNEKEVQAPEEIVEVKDDFGSAFEEAAGHSDTEEKPAEAPETERAEDFPKEDATEEKPTEEQTPVTETPPNPAEEIDYKKLFEDEQHKRTTLEGMYNKTAEELDTLKKAPPATPPPAPEPEVTLDAELMQDEEIKGFLEEYDYLAKPIQKIIKATLAKAKPDASIDEKIAPVLEFTNLIKQGMTHQTTITEAHPDFATLRDTGALREFVETAPEAERVEFQRVYADGSSQEVIKLVDKYKEAKKASSAANSNGDGGLSEPKKEKLSNLTAVSTGKRPLNTDSKGKPETFEDAFDQAASSK